jgi:ATP-binding cassette subfamily B protein
VFRLLQTVYPQSARRLVLVTVCQAIATGAEAAIVALLVPLLAALGSNAAVVGLPRIALLESPAVSFPLLLGVLGGAFALRAVAQAGAVWLWSAGVERYETLHRERLLRGLLRADHACQSREPSGRLQHVLTHHGESTARAFTALAWGGAHLVQVGCLAVCSWIVSPVPALFAAAALVGIVLLLRPLTKFAGAAAKRRADAVSRYVHRIGQTSALFKELRIFGATANYLRQAEAASTVIARERRRQNIVGSLLPTLYQTSAGLLLLAGAGMVHFAGNIAGAAPVVSLLLLLRAAAAAQHLHSTYNQLQDTRPALEEMLTLEKQYAEAELPAGGLPLERIDRIELRGVDFAYQAGRNVLTDVRLDVERGDVVAIVGPSGAGKSTLIQLLLGLRSATRGCLLINGSPAELFRTDDFFTRSAFVAQEPAFFNESIADCIRFGRREVTDLAVATAAHEAGLLDDIERMTDGFMSLVGERGTSLSLGQRQRLSIARALVGRPDLLVFDEPTAALDAESEERIVATLAALRGRATTFVVTHRPALLRACNRILNVADGHVAEIASTPRTAHVDGLAA